MKPISIINKLNESVQPLDKEKYFNLMDAVDELIISVNGNKAQLQDVLKDVTEMFNKAINKLTESEYRYVTTHGTGPGTLPKDVNLIKSEDINSNGKVAIYVDRPLTKEELEKYDIRPEWIQEGNDFVIDKDIDEPTDLKKLGRCPYCTKKLVANDDWFIKKYGMCQECFENGVE